MEVEEVQRSISNSSNSENALKNTNSIIMEIITHLVENQDISFKSQQRGEDEITDETKRDIALNIFEKSKSNFLARFGKHFKPEHLEYFKQYCNDEDDGYAIQFYLNDLSRYHNEELRKKDVKNRRFQALRKLINDSTYFSEVEMMRRNPLLYEQLVGQYLTEDERKMRDKLAPEDCSFANILLEGYQREKVQELKHRQEDNENEVEMESESDEEDDEMTKEEKRFESYNVYSENTRPSCSNVKKPERWGEWDNKEDQKQDEIANSIDTVKRDKNWFLVSDSEKQLFKEEFESYMFQSFLDGKDIDFDYSTVDCDTSYDNIDVKSQDDEEKYFDSESPEEVVEKANKNEADQKMHSDKGDESSEDELDVFMERLSQHPTVCELASKLENCKTFK